MNRSLWFLLGAIILLALVFELGFSSGQRSAISDLSEDKESVYFLKSEVTRLEEALQNINGEREVLQTRHEIDRQSQELLRSEIAGHKEEVGEIQEALRFYRSLMSPDDITSGLSLREPELIQGDRPQVFLYRVVAQQEAIRHKLIEGNLVIEVTGTSGDETVTLPLAELDVGYSAEAMKLKFRYFQTFAGEIKLPDGFEPAEIYLLAKASKPKRVDVGQRFPWKLQERMTNVGE
jgi:Family of unknown function (DUF6776)